MTGRSVPGRAGSCGAVSAGGGGSCHAAVAAGAAPYGRMLPGIRGVRLTVLRVDAKFKYDDANPVEHRQRVIGRLEPRGHGLDAGAAVQQRRRLAAIGDWKTRQHRP